MGYFCLLNPNAVKLNLYINYQSSFETRQSCSSNAKCRYISVAAKVRFHRISIDCDTQSPDSMIHSPSFQIQERKSNFLLVTFFCSQVLLKKVDLFSRFRKKKKKKKKKK